MAGRSTFAEKIRRENMVRELKRTKELIKEKRPCEAEWTLGRVIEKIEGGKTP